MSISVIFKWPFCCFLFMIISTSQAFSASKNHISYELEFKTYESMRLKLEKDLSLKLKNRGEAHITLVTPPEFKKLSHHIKPEEIHELAQDFLKTKPPFENVCVGSGELKTQNQTEKTFFVVVKSNAFLQFREKLAERAQITKAEFDPHLFYPHITLGFTTRDLHFEDGVIKNDQTCLK